MDLLKLCIVIAILYSGIGLFLSWKTNESKRFFSLSLIIMTICLFV